MLYGTGINVLLLLLQPIWVNIVVFKAAAFVWVSHFVHTCCLFITNLWCVNLSNTNLKQYEPGKCIKVSK